MPSSQAQMLQKQLEKHSTLDENGVAPRDYPGKEVAWIPNLEVHIEEIRRNAGMSTEDASEHNSRELV